ncbi:MAG: polysaccharide biosynthesis tyrosine autokinase [Acidobacteria bacterium]|nr:polysaccharide biosynthesis tyrosine autokinase [Acidobacteriota bacterium]
MNHLDKDLAPLGPSAPPAAVEWAGGRGRYGMQVDDFDADPEHAPLHTYWRLLTRHKGAIALAAVCGAIVGVLVSLPQTPVYESEVSIEIQGLNQGFLGMEDVNPTQDSRGGLQSADLATQVEIIQSRTLVSAVADKLQEDYQEGPMEAAGGRLGAWMQALGLREDKPKADTRWSPAVAMAAHSVKATPSRNSRIVRIRTESMNPQLAAKFSNTLAEHFITESIESRWEATQYTEDWLDRQLDDLKIKLEESEDRLQASADASGLIFTSEASNVVEQELEQVQASLSDARADRIAKQSRYELASSSPPESLPDVLDSQALAGYQLELNRLRQELANLRTTFTDSYPDVKRRKAEIAELETAMRRESKNIIERIRNEYDESVRREKLLQAAYDSQATAVSDQARKSIQYNILKREVETNRQLYETILQKGKEARLAAAMKASPVRVVDEAVASRFPVKPNHVRNSLLGAVGGLFLGVVFVVGRERVDRTIKNPGDAEFYLGASELGFIPAITAPSSSRKVRVRLLRGGSSSDSKGRPEAKNGNGTGKGHGLGLQPIRSTPAAPEKPQLSPELVAWNEQNSWATECVQATLTSILFSPSNGNGRGPRQLVVTSGSPGEGKSTVVSNLAAAIAEINQTVLVIDADMRRQRQHRIFGVENEQGLSDLLRHPAKLDADMLKLLAKQTPLPGVMLLPSGPGASSVSNLLHSDRTRELLTIAHENFDWVLIDTPPMIQLADARLLGRLVDGVVLVVKAGSTTRDSVSACQERLRKDGTKLYGSVLNHWNPKASDPGYYGQYYRYEDYYRRPQAS